MTMTEIRKTIRARKLFTRRVGNDLTDYYNDISRALEGLWRDGYVAGYDVSSDVLSLANGYQVSTGNYDTFHISQTYDLRSISVDDKQAVKEFGEFILM